MPTTPGRVLITGANGHLGVQLTAELAAASTETPARPVRALVRSDRAAEKIRKLEVDPAPELVIADYGDRDAMLGAMEGCDQVVHLVGIIKETRAASYRAAHEETCELLTRVAAETGVRHFVYLSIFGADAGSPNACLASKGRAADILMAGDVPTTVFRVPMVLGPDDYASAALRRDAHAGRVMMVRGGATLHQPIDSRDVIAAIRLALETPPSESRAFDLGGPESLSHRELVLRAARLAGNTPRILPVPAFLSMIFAGLMERISADPPVTRAMLEVLQHDDRVDTEPVCKALGLSLRPLDETLSDFVIPSAQERP